MKTKKRSVFEIVIFCVFLSLCLISVVVYSIRGYTSQTLIKGDIDIINNTEVYDAVLDELDVDSEQVKVVDWLMLRYEENEVAQYSVNVEVNKDGEREMCQIGESKGKGVRINRQGTIKGDVQFDVTLQDSIRELKLVMDLVKPMIEATNYNVYIDSSIYSSACIRISGGGYFLNDGKFEPIETDINKRCKAIRIGTNGETYSFYYPV